MTYEYDPQSMERTLALRQIRDQENQKHTEEKHAHHQAHLTLPPKDLADALLSKLDTHDIHNPQQLLNRLSEQANILHATFITSAHEAGLGFENTLHDNKLAAAFIAQKLFRQTFETILTGQEKLSENKKDENEKKDLKTNGPKTAKGKHKSKMNALTHGATTQDQRALRAALTAQQKFLQWAKEALKKM